MNRTVPLSPSEMSTLIALYEVAPATIKLINCARGMKYGSHAPLGSLRARGLISRKTVGRQIPLTDEERLNGRQLRIGKRPYQYSLTEKGRTVAHHLQAICNQFVNGSGSE